jgi:hypothetical protein
MAILFLAPPEEVLFAKVNESSRLRLLLQICSLDRLAFTLTKTKMTEAIKL